MKKLSLFTLLLFFFTFNKANQNSHRLISLNKYWQGVEIEQFAGINLEELSENDLIRFHLEEVIDSLRSVDLNHLNSSQKAKRKHLLHRLSVYAVKGVFPKNTYHQVRTPYFIDRFGTPCAVGYMIIESGHGTLSERISREMNYAYIEEMPYPEIDRWAKDHGFSLTELKWIQPGYGPQCAKDTAIPPSCPNGIGCINPDFYKANLDSSTLYIEASERNTGSGWQLDTNMWIYFYQGFFPYGLYRFCLADSLNQRDTLYYDIMGPTPFVLKDSVLQASNNCFNRIQLSARNGQPPYQFRLYRMPSYTQMPSTGSIFDSLCPGDYVAELIDSNFCIYNKQLTISGISSVSANMNNKDHCLIQNPILNNSLQLRTDLKGIKRIRVFSLGGKLLEEAQFGTEEFIRTVDWENGIYILQISNDDKRINKKVVVSN